jgi:hypothetical protein
MKTHPSSILVLLSLVIASAITDPVVKIRQRDDRRMEQFAESVRIDLKKAMLLCFEDRSIEQYSG